MCTVTYIPTDNGFHITSNRDESVNRGQAISPQRYDGDKKALLYPQDADKKGSWIAAKNNGDLVVLLNGAFVKHNRKPAYKKSRGLILMDIINAGQPYQYYKTVDLGEIEPFTVILFAAGKLYECRWDGSIKHIAKLDDKEAYIWSSATLYDKMAIAKRNSWFSDWTNSAHPKTTAGILNFHRYGGNGDLKDGLVINREGIMKTMSITNINVKPGNVTMTYHDLKDDRQYKNELAIEPAVVIPSSAAKIPFLKLRIFLIRLFNWEFWSFNAVYAPILFYWFWLSLKARSLFFFNTANPHIENGGFAMESKWKIYQQTPKKYSPFTLFFKAGTAIEDIKSTLKDIGLPFPMIAKPDIGGRGILVKLVHNEAELSAYISTIKVDYLLQQYIPYNNEVGIFYYRIPGEDKGRLSGIVGKAFLTVTGDGKSTVKDLIIKNPRYLLQLSTLVQSHAHLLEEVLANGEEKVLVPYGNHARGAKFIDLSHLITPQLTAVIDNVCLQIPDFYFGRMDVMYNNWDELSEGKNFSIVELNGAGSEPTHIYDPKHSIFFGWKEIMRHWELLNRISRINAREKKLSYMTYAEGMAMLKSNTAYLKLVS